MASLDLTIYPYERMVNTSYKRPYHDDCFCICKDELLECLNKILSIENFKKYNCYLYGKINSSCAFPTWDCDMLISSSSEQNNEEISNLFNAIKNIGLSKNLNFDLKYITDIEVYNKAVETPDDLIDVNNMGYGYDISNNKFILFNSIKKMRIRKEKNKEWTYYKPLLIKAENSSSLNQIAIDFITNSNLPDSSERNNEFSIRRRFVFNEETQKYTNTYL